MAYGKLQGSVRVSALVTGDRALDRSLAALARVVERKVTRQALRAGAKVVRAAARSNAPVDTGLMRSTVAVRAGKARRRGEVLVNVELVRRAQLLSASGDAFYYPAAVEFGRKAAVASAGRSRPGRAAAATAKAVPGVHWMRRARVEADAGAKAVVMAELRAGVERAAAAASAG